MFGEKLANAFFLTHENDRKAVLLSGLYGPVNLNNGSGIAPHRIDSNLRHIYSSATSITSRSL